MEDPPPYRVLAAACAVLLLSLPASADERAGATRRMGDDFFSTGRAVYLSAEVPGDALLAGGEVTSEGDIGGDAVAAGGRIRLSGSVGDDMYAAGGDVRVSANVTGSARVAGGQVEITDDAVISDGLSVAGGRIDVNGRVGSYLQATGGRIRINGQVDGNVIVTGGELAVGPRADIRGELIFRGRQKADIASGARISGAVHNLPPLGAGEEREHRIFGAAMGIWLIGWLIVGIVLLALLPETTRAVTDTVRSRPWQSLLLGLALLVVAPFLMVLFVITLIGIPLALLLLFAYLLLLPLGYLASVTSLGDWLAQRVRRDRPVTNMVRIGLFVAALIVVYLVTRIPVLGGLLALLLVLFGSGGIALAFLARWRRRPTEALPA